jgi:pantoate kinase
MVMSLKSSVFVPSHITGFFEIVDNSDPLKKGSRGAGIVLDKGVLTKIVVEDGNGNVNVEINGKSQSKLALISYKTIELIKNRFQIDEKNISIAHHFEVPIGTGFGVSAACSLGTSLGVTKAIELPLTYNEAASIAHLTEIEMKSGLGDVIAELTGGIVLRLKEGSPGVGRTDKIIQNQADPDVNQDLFIITKTMGEIETSHIIEDPIWKKRINQTGKDLLHILLKRPKVSTFLKLSRKFAEETALMDSELKEVVEILGEETLGASMAMLGKTAFAISETPDTSVDGVIVSKIDNLGCRYV